MAAPAPLSCTWVDDENHSQICATKNDGFVRLRVHSKDEDAIADITVVLTMEETRELARVLCEYTCDKFVRTTRPPKVRKQRE